MRWGLSLSLSDDLAQPELIGEVAAVAERSGWDGVFVWDHLWNRTGAPFADPWVTLATVALATERVRLGPLVTPLPRRRTQVVAQQAATLDRLSAGRLILGLGLGHDDYGEYSKFDEPLTTSRARAESLDAGLEMLTGDLAGAGTTIPPAQTPRYPIWVAGRPDRSAGWRRVIRHDLEGIALVGSTEWLPPQVAAGIGELAGSSVDVALVGGRHPDPPALAAAGATWAVKEVHPGTSGADALAIAGSPPG